MTEKKIPLPEAPASVNFKGVTKGGFVCQWTLRDIDEAVLLDKQVKFMALLSEGGVQPYPATKPNGNGGSQNTISVPLLMGDVPPPAQPQEDLFFDAERLVGSTSGDKTYFKVQGGKFSKFGVNIWPEILEAAGFDPDQLDPKTTYDLTGYTAYYSLKDNGKEDKVINLAKP